MSDALNEAAEALRGKLGGGGFDGSVKFDVTGEGSILLDGAGVSTEGGDADCTISGSLDTFRDMFEGNLDPTSAFMTGKIRIDGDMGVAMKLARLFG